MVNSVDQLRNTPKCAEFCVFTSNQSIKHFSARFLKCCSNIFSRFVQEVFKLSFIPPQNIIPIGTSSLHKTKYWLGWLQLYLSPKWKSLIGLTAIFIITSRRERPMAADLPNYNLKTILTLLRVRFQNYWIEVSLCFQWITVRVF